MNESRQHTLLALSILWIVQLALIVTWIWGILPDGGVPFDDAWIHFSFARNLALRGEMSFNPGQWSGGTTSPLWVIALALGYRLSGRMLATAYVLGGACYLASAAALYALLEAFCGRTREGRILALSGALGYAAIGFLPYLALSGMDTLLFLALSLGSLAAYARGRHAASGWLLAALVITRIEGLGMVLVVGVAALASLARPSRRRVLLQVIVPPACALGLYLLFNWAVTGHLLPTTMAGRKWLWGMGAGWWAFSLERTRAFLREWGTLLADFSLGGRRLPALLLAGLSGAGAIEVLVEALRRRQGALGIALLAGWALVHNGAYLCLAPLASWRHQAPNLVLLPALAAAGALVLVRAFRAPRRPWAAVACGLAALVCLLPGTASYRQTFVDNVGHVNSVHAAAGRWIDANLPHDAVVAAFDIGAVRYLGGRRTLDLGGLTDVGFVRDYLYPGRVEDYIYERGATYLVMPEPAEPNQADLTTRLGISSEGPEAGLRLHPQAHFEVAPYIRPAYTSLRYQFYPAYLRMGIYEIEWLR